MALDHKLNVQDADTSLCPSSINILNARDENLGSQSDGWFPFVSSEVRWFFLEGGGTISSTEW